MLEKYPGMNFRPAPVTRAKFIGETTGSTILTEEIPGRIVEDVIINYHARSFLPKDYAYLFNKDFLLAVAQMSVPAKKDSDKGVLVPGFWGRTTVLAYGEIPVAGKFIYGMLAGKGSFLTGHYYSDDVPAREHPTHWGIWSNEGARLEVRVSNGLLDNGFRSALVPGYLVLDTNKLESWLLPIWAKRDHQRAVQLEESLSMIRKERNSPAFMLRLCGIGERLTHQSLSFENDKQAHFSERRRAAAAVGSRLLVKEARAFPDEFSRYLTTELSMTDVMRVLNKITMRQRLNRRELFVYTDLIAGIFKNNAEALSRFVSRNAGRGRAYPMIAYTLTALKDIDMAFVTQDFEEVDRESIGLKKVNLAEVKKEYLEQVAFYLGRLYLGGEFSKGFLNSKNLSHEDDRVEAEMLSVFRK